MLNYAETASSSTILPVTPLPQSQYQEYTPDSLMSMLSTLLAHPEFARGLMSAHASFLEAFEPAPLTQDEMIEEVEEYLSRESMELDGLVREMTEQEPVSFYYNLGMVVGTIAKGLTYDEAQRLAR